jgi:catalase
MAKKSVAKTTRTAQKATTGAGGETHQQANGADERLTTNQGVVIADNQNSLKAGQRGPTLLEDFIFREKITHFDHERIPERIVHARGSGAHGYFQPYKNWSGLTKAAFLSDPKQKTRVFVRFSTVAGGAGSVDTARDVRGFAVKFYTAEGNFDLVGNNIPVFFIQDAIKFPDLIHSVKMEPDRGFPQAASAHDTFWDFISLMPESTHMVMWAMSDRAIPRSYRMMEGFGIHTFRFINASGKSTFVKFHWRPVIGSSSLIWDEAVKIAGADSDFHRRDLWQAIEDGDYPEFEFGVQAFDEKTAAKLDFDVLDPTKIIPEEVVPLQMLGKMVLDRNPDNFFAETEQAAFHPGHVVPGIDFTNDPLLQGRLFSYLDTQISRLGGPNFHEIPINKPVCPMRNFQRDAMHRMAVARGRTAYEPNSLDEGGPREDPRSGFSSHAEAMEGTKLRQRPESFADHYSQARQFWLSMTEPEQRHIVSAFAFELGKVQTMAVRTRMLGRLKLVHGDLCAGVEGALGMEGMADTLTPAVAPRTLKPSPALSIVQKAQPTLQGRKLGILVTDDSDAGLVAELRKAAKAEGAAIEIVAPKIGGVVLDDGSALPADHALSGAPSVMFDAVAVLVSEEGCDMLLNEAAAIDWLRDAFGHLKVIGHVSAAGPLLDKAAIEPDAGVVGLEGRGAVKAFIAAARQQRIWDREPGVRSPG